MEVTTFAVKGAMAMPPFGPGKVRPIPWHGSSGDMQAESPIALRFLVDAQAGALNVHMEQ